MSDRELLQQALGEEWQPCVKLPVVVHVRKQREGETHVSTREGITPVRPDDLIMRGVAGEEYPIGRELFERTYRLGESLAAPEPASTRELLTRAAAMAVAADRAGKYEGASWVADAVMEAALKDKNV